MKKILLSAMLLPAINLFAQNVGIGTIAPTDKLSVIQTGSNAAGSFEVDNPAFTGPALIGKTNGTSLTSMAIYGFRGSSTIIPSSSTAIMGENSDGTGITGISKTGLGAYAASLNSDGLFGVTLNGSAGVHGRNDNNGGYGVWGESYGTGIGVYGYSTGNNAGKFLINNAANASIALEGTTNGTGAGVKGSNTATSGLTSGVIGTVSSISNGEAVNNGVSGLLGIVSSTEPGGYSAGVRGVNNGTSIYGVGVIGYHAGSGWGVYGECPSGWAVYGLASNAAGTGVGVRGEIKSPNGIAVEAKYSGTGVGTALEIDNGAIRVAGANKSAFRHTATAASITGYLTVIDNPMINGDPNAMLFVTHVYVDGPVGGVYVTHPVSVYYSTSASKWYIYHDDFAAMTVNTVFNVLVIKQ